jgi:hypothetical protein
MPSKQQIKAKGCLMKRIIVEVLQIIPAHNVFIGHELDEIETLIPIAFYAQVNTFNLEFPSLGMEKQIIAVQLDDFQDDLVGADIERFNYQSLVHLAKVQANQD